MEEYSDSLNGFAHISEIIRYLISGTTAFILYWPFVWIVLNLNYFEKNDILAVFLNAYKQFPLVSTSWSAVPLIIILPYFGLLNRAVIYTLLETSLIKYCFKDQATCNEVTSNKKFFLSEISCKIRKRSILCLKKQFDMISGENIVYLESCINPCWQLSGSFEYIDFREWLLKDKIRSKIWDHERLMYGVFGSFFLTFLTFVILYILSFASNLIFSYLNNQINFTNYFFHPLIILIVLLTLTSALYINYLHHRFDWLAMNIRYYVKFLIDERKVLLDIENVKDLRKYLLCEQYDKLYYKLKEIHNNIKSEEYVDNKIVFPDIKNVKDLKRNCLLCEQYKKQPVKLNEIDNNAKSGSLTMSQCSENTVSAQSSVLK